MSDVCKHSMSGVFQDVESNRSPGLFILQGIIAFHIITYHVTTECELTKPS